MLAPIHTLGPGERIGLWVQGCSRCCPHCISPELQPPSSKDVPEDLLAEVIRQTAQRSKCSGFTVSGGEPFEQPEALFELLSRVRDDFDDILVYTGYELQEIASGKCGAAACAALQFIDVLIDGAYVHDRNTQQSVLRGSDNQKIHFLDPAVRETYIEYMEKGRQVENFVLGENMVIVGIMKRGDI